jgi:RNA polymerase sigma factor (sigma-70 family)
MTHITSCNTSKISEQSLRFLEGPKSNMPRQIPGRLEGILAKFTARYSFDNASAEAACLRSMSDMKRLSIRDEVLLAQRWLDEGDEAALEQLALSYLPLLFRICLRDRNFGEDYLDVFHDAVAEMMGILWRLDEFDVDRFSSNVGFRVLECRVRRIAKMARPMSGPSGVMKVRCITHLSRHDISEVDEWDVEQAAMRSGLRKEDIGTLLEWITPEDPIDPDSLASERDDVEQALVACDVAKLNEALGAALDDRARDIVTRRYLGEEPVDAIDLGKKWGITDARVRQIEREGLADLRAFLEGRPTSRSIRERKKIIAEEGRRLRAPKRLTSKTEAQKTPSSKPSKNWHPVVDGLELIPAMSVAGFSLEQHEAKVLRLRHIDKKQEVSVSVVAERMSLPQKRVRQIEKLAIRKLRQSLSRRVEPAAVKVLGGALDYASL